MITTSEVALSVTIDDLTHIDAIQKELQKYGHVQLDKAQTIVCVVGDFREKDKGVAFSVMEALKHIPLRMISYGGSYHNISLLINTTDKKEALKSLNKLFS